MTVYAQGPGGPPGNTGNLCSFGLNVSVAAEAKLGSAGSFSVAFPLLSCLIWNSFILCTQ